VENGMNRKRIRIATILALLLIVAWSIALFLIYALGSSGIVAKDDPIAQLLIFLSFLLAGGALFAIVFGVWGPLAGRWVYDHLLNFSQREYLNSFAFWRFYLNISN
jgi:hypothetical protein